MNPAFKGEDEAGNKDSGFFSIIDGKSGMWLGKITLGEKEGVKIGSNHLKMDTVSLLPHF